MAQNYFRNLNLR